MWKRLRSLEVGYLDEDSVGGEEAARGKGGSRRVTKHRAIVTLILKYPRSTKEVADFVALFPKVKSVELVSSDIDFTLVLNALGDKVNSIALGDSTQNLPAPSPSRSDHSLLKFRNLRFLRIGAIILTPLFVDQIQHLSSLRKLILLPKSFPNASDVEKIIKSPPKSLKSVFLRNLDFIDAETYAVDHLDVVSDIDWRTELPEWRETFDLDMAHSLRRLAWKEKVDLGEGFYSALDSVQDFEDYMADLEEYEFER